MAENLPVAADAVILATGLRFPEGPVALDDGSLFVVEVAGECVTRVGADGTTTRVADVPGGPNGAASCGEGLLLCNNGGFFAWHDIDGMVVPGPTPATWTGGSIDRVDLATGSVTTVWDRLDERLQAPNDLVLDGHGGVWFTDHGVRQEEGSGNAHLPSVLYGTTDGGDLRGAVVGLDAANGIGLSPAGDELYAAETHTGRLWAWPVVAPGSLGRHDDGVGPHGGRLLFDAPEGHLFDSLAVDAAGAVVVGTLAAGGLTVVDPSSREAAFIALPDPLITNVCFTLDGLGAFCTGSGTGVVMVLPWPRPGTPLAS
ncbi:SMP-30/gluconolactonase/LRE family protein [Rhabdothermincola salaria]|uniref:SMP-30/gluconolactonase/LRE family protein n=1 Tax=Rhabdothermincola salaria TaxID=2903142 RepID=UPI001E4F3828|nr:SMP-30/gluconolactonase/LRE family protein [Rhabdothermincola salaria]MCD9624894.1 SMP-30/gluconolactonase/LRE family protein [Rhabdothermincola salaria]